MGEHIIVMILLSLVTFLLGFGVSQLTVVKDVSVHGVEIKGLNKFKEGHSAEHIELMKTFNQILLELRNVE